MGRLPVPASTFDAERLADLTDFRCASCNDRYPYRLIDDETYRLTGRAVCTVNCAQNPRSVVKDEQAAQAKADAAELTADNVQRSADRMAKGKAWSLVANEPAVEGISSSFGRYPVAAELWIGGASVVVTVVGVNFSSDDTVAYSTAQITNAVPVSRTPTVTTLTVQATVSAVAGYYDLIFNGDRYPGVFRVRS